MDADQVLAEARADGFELGERTCDAAWVWGWARSDDERRPCYLERRQAIDWMRDRLRRAGVRLNKQRERVARQPVGAPWIAAVDSTRVYVHLELAGGKACPTSNTLV